MCEYEIRHRSREKKRKLKTLLEAYSLHNYENLSCVFLRSVSTHTTHDSLRHVKRSSPKKSMEIYIMGTHSVNIIKY